MSIEVAARRAAPATRPQMFTWEHVRRFWCDRKGATAAEYALVLAVIGASVATALLVLSGSMSTAVSNTSGAMPFQGP